MRVEEVFEEERRTENEDEQLQPVAREPDRAFEETDKQRHRREPSRERKPEHLAQRNMLLEKAKYAADQRALHETEVVIGEQERILDDRIVDREFVDDERRHHRDVD